jgi:hypothetical protein
VTSPWTMTAAEAAAYLGLDDADAAIEAMRQAGIEPLHRRPKIQGYTYDVAVVLSWHATTRQPGQAVTPVDRSIVLYIQGHGWPHITASTGATKSGVRKALRRRAISRRGIGGGHATLRITLPDKEIADAYRGGVSVNALAVRYGVSRKVIETRLDRLGVLRRGQVEATRLANSGPRTHR